MTVKILQAGLDLDRALKAMDISEAGVFGNAPAQLSPDKFIETVRMVGIVGKGLLPEERQGFAEKFLQSAAFENYALKKGPRATFAAARLVSDLPLGTEIQSPLIAAWNVAQEDGRKLAIVTRRHEQQAAAIIMSPDYASKINLTCGTIGLKSVFGDRTLAQWGCALFESVARKAQPCSWIYTVADTTVQTLDPR